MQIFCYGEVAAMRSGVMFSAVFVVALLAGAAFAVQAGKTLIFDKGPQGEVAFDGSKHAIAGLKCTDCHRKDLFPKMKKGTVSITMNDIYDGRYCGACHNGVKAFGAQDNCVKCHAGEQR
jgi:c(7)-type cytochrome triheme protein